MTPQTILFIGSTGGCTNSCLTRALHDGHHCVALVRTPDKLISKLQTDQSLPESLLASNLTTVAGNAKSIPDLQAALLSRSAPDGTALLPETIVSGLGSTGALAWQFCRPLQIFKVDDPTLCRNAATALVSALREIYTAQPALRVRRPRLVFVSTTGVTRGPEDVPMSMRLLYHKILAEPHEDKKEMENVFRAEVEQGEGKGNGVFENVSCVRPTLLSGTGNTEEGKGVDMVKAGTEDRPELGFSITRGEVGGWMYENLVREGKQRDRWVGQMCSLTT